MNLMKKKIPDEMKLEPSMTIWKWQLNNATYCIALTIIDSLLTGSTKIKVQYRYVRIQRLEYSCDMDE